MGVYKRGNKNWWFSLGHKGITIREHGGRTRAQAENALVRRRSQLKEGEEEAELKPATFTEYSEVYLTLCQGNKAIRTLDRDRYTIDKHLIPFYGQKQLIALKTTDIEEYKQFRRPHAAPSTINREFDTLKAMLMKAVEWHYLRKNPAAGVGKFFNPPRPPRFLNEDECHRLLDASKKSRNRCLHPFVSTALYAGLRKDELFHLEWSNVDMERGVLKIVNKDGWHTKSKKGREVPMPKSLREILKEHSAHPESPYVFYNADGTRFHDIRRGYANAVKGAGLDHITFHTLRHTYASHLVMKGTDLPTVQQLLGHSDIKTTMRYAHLAPDHLRLAVEDFDFEPDSK
jgi:integrase